MSKDHIDHSLSKIRIYFEEASTILEALPVGGKITATGLAAKVAEKHGLTGPTLYPVLKFLFEGYPQIKQTRGAHGGLEKLPQ
jgi:hypothetical protein